MFKRSKWMILLAAILVMALALTGCGEKKEEGEKAPAEQSAEKQSITIAGSTSVQPLSEELVKVFQEKNPGVTINVQGGGSSQGVKAATEGICEIGAASRNLKDTEKGLTTHQIAVDGIAVVVSPKNALTELSADQVKKIFSGEITNWKEVGGADGAINVVTREAGSGTRGAFEEMALGEEVKITDKAITQASNGAVRQTVAGDEKAIGYLSLGYVNEEVKGVKYEGTEPTVDNIKAGNYKVSRPFLYLTKGEPQGVAKDYIDFVLSPEGQEIVAKEYITVK
ncbi:MAG: phosphate-binding protein [Peptococcaceae bacterium BRH_c4b]|nr:MAG: phosphate-binding protein [Peptococcaceae bacterium BRH_c4b]